MSPRRKGGPITRVPQESPRTYEAWQTRAKFRLTQLETLQHPSLTQQMKMQELRKKLYGNLQWYIRRT